MRVGLRKVEDALINLGSYRKVNPNYGNKNFVLQAIYKHDYDTLREISNYFYEANGIYYRLCRYMAYLYRYDWYVTPFVIDAEKEKQNKILTDFAKVLSYLDNSDTKRLCGDIVLEVMRNGVYYGIIMDFGDKFGIQKLPPAYCRCRYYSGIDPIVELNLRFFDAYFSNPQYKIKVLKMFPVDVQKAYVAYKQNKLKGDYPGDTSYWYPLDPGMSVKISMNDSDFPPFVGIIPSLIDLDQAQELDRKKTMQQLLKIIIQKLPLDKNGDLIFDVDEAKDIHNNAVMMLRKAIGVDVLTTFADIDVADMRDKNTTTTTDDLKKAERTVFNNSGTSQNLFNAEGNLAVTNSILNDEASIHDLILRLSSFFNRLIAKFNRKNHYTFTFGMLDTTQYNYKELSKIYKEQASLGYGKVFPQLALGHSQSSILATFTFENDILHLAESMIPPMSSNTMSSNALTGKNAVNKSGEQKTAGRPEKEDSEKSDKTIQNRESES